MWQKSRRALWYIFLAYIPTMLGFRNIQSGGEFFPAFIGGLMLVAIPFVMGELFLLFLHRYDRDQKIWLTIVLIIQLIIFGGLFFLLCYLAPFLVLSAVVVVTIYFVFTSAGTLLKRYIPGLNDWLAVLGNAWSSFSEAVGRVTEVVGRVIVVLSILAIWAALLWSFAPNQDLTSKPLASLTLDDVAGIVLWLGILVFGGRILLFAMFGEENQY